MERENISPTIEQLGGAEVVDGYKSMICHLAPAGDTVRVVFK